METRKYYLDWLRVLAFLFLVLFHVGMLYVAWPYNIKSPRLVPQAEWAMSALAAWRLALLFFISGVASRFLIAKLGAGRFALDRLRRLLPVILFGMFVVIPPQTYVELVSKGVTHQDYLSFWLHSYLAADQTLVRPLHKTMPTWDHLWFLVYLLVYALGFAAVFAISRRAKAVPHPLPLVLLLIAPALWLAAANVAIWQKPLTHALVNDGAGHLKWAGMFVIGALCAMQEPFWQWVRTYPAALLALAAGLYALENMVDDPLWSVVSGLYAWAAICALCGYAYRYLNRPSALLSHLNEAVLPIYVLHQPILLIAAYLIFPLRLPLAAEAGLLAAITGFGSFAIYELAIRPWWLMRFVFGLKPRPASVA
ncbi:MAG: acyltransferase family protein [Rhizomicrobium sp.]